MVCNGGPGGGNKDKDGFSIFDHPYWLAGIGFVLVGLIIGAYFMFKSKGEDTDGDEGGLEMSGSEN